MSDKQILVILIDPETKTIEVDTVDDNLESMQKMIGGDIRRCEASLGEAEEVLWCDEEGALKENFHFHVKGFTDIISGKSFVCREVESDDGFVNDDTQLDVATLQGLVTWLPHLDGQTVL